MSPETGFPLSNTDIRGKEEIIFLRLLDYRRRNKTMTSVILYETSVTDEYGDPETTFLE